MFNETRNRLVLWDKSYSLSRSLLQCLKLKSPLNVGFRVVIGPLTTTPVTSEMTSLWYLRSPSSVQINKNDVVLRSKIAVYCITKINNNSFVALQTCIFYIEVDKGHWSLAIHNAPVNYSTCNKSHDWHFRSLKNSIFSCKRAQLISLTKQ